MSSPPPLSDVVIFEQLLILFQYKITAASLIICNPLRILSNISVSPTAHSSMRWDVSSKQWADFIVKMTMVVVVEMMIIKQLLVVLVFMLQHLFSEMICKVGTSINWSSARERAENSTSYKHISVGLILHCSKGWESNPCLGKIIANS